MRMQELQSYINDKGSILFYEIPPANLSLKSTFCLNLQSENDEDAEFDPRSGYFG